MVKEGILTFCSIRGEGSAVGKAGKDLGVEMDRVRVVVEGQGENAGEALDRLETAIAVGEEYA